MKNLKKFLTKGSGCDNLNRLTCEGEKTETDSEKKMKKVLDKEKMV